MKIYYLVDCVDWDCGYGYLTINDDIPGNALQNAIYDTKARLEYDWTIEDALQKVNEAHPEFDLRYFDTDGYIEI